MERKCIFVSDYISQLPSSSCSFEIVSAFREKQFLYSNGIFFDDQKNEVVKVE